MPRNTDHTKAPYHIARRDIDPSSFYPGGYRIVVYDKKIIGFLSVIEPIPPAIPYHKELIDVRDPLLKILTPRQIPGTLEVVLEEVVLDRAA